MPERTPITLGGMTAFAILIFFWIGTQPFLNLSSADAAYNSLAQLIIVILSGLAIIQSLGLKSPVSWSSFLPVGMLFVWLMISAFAAEDSAIALRNSVIQALFLINAALLPLLPKSHNEFARIASIPVLIALALSYYGVWVLPQLSIHQTNDLLEPMLAGLWRGHYIHKNAASAAMVVTIFFSFYSYSKGTRLLAAVLMVGGAYFLLHTGGKTSLATLPAILVLAWIVERYSWVRMPLIVGGLVAFNIVTIGSAFSPDVYDTLKSIGIDPTFTNRTDIWRIALPVALESPLTGVGMHTFWGSYKVLYGGGDIETWAYTAGTAHNGYLDVAMNIGVPGLLLVVFVFVLRPITQISRAFASENDPALTRLFLRIWLFGIVNSTLESLFFARGGIHWFLFMVAVFGIQYQARARLVPATNPIPDGRFAHA